MILKQYYLGCLAHASYLVADEESRLAAVVDPQRDIDQYLDDARQRGFDIRHVFLTHFHADFLAGHLELRDRTGARIYLGRRAKAEYDFTPLGDGDAVSLGRVRFTALETPGHSPESICLLVHDLGRPAAAADPYAVLTGDTLFIGDVGRPDLRAALGWSAEELAGLLYDSLRTKLLTLPDETLVYPTHGAGSLCGRNLSKDTVSTIGVQRRYNYALAPMSRDDFIKIITADQPEAPAYFTYDAVLNTKERPTLDDALARGLRPLPLASMLAVRHDGGQLLDAREPPDYWGAHLADTTNIPLGGQYATWAGTLLDRARPIAIVAPRGREREAAMRLGRIGFDHVAGYLEDGMEAAGARGDLVRRRPRMTAHALAELLDSASPPVVLDVRTETERKQAGIPGSLHIPLARLLDRLGDVPDGPGTVVVHCASGYRSSIAASILEQHGIEDVADLAGGFAAWTASGLPTAPGSAGAPGVPAAHAPAPAAAPARSLDLRGAVCPGPTFDTRMALKEMTPGQTLEVVTDYYPAKQTIPALMQELGYPCELRDGDQAVFRFIIRKV
jgi:hydroxyacylglutathione hydrolase